MISGIKFTSFGFRSVGWKDIQDEPIKLHLRNKIFLIA